MSWTEFCLRLNLSQTEFCLGLHTAVVFRMQSFNMISFQLPPQLGRELQQENGLFTTLEQCFLMIGGTCQ